MLIALASVKGSPGVTSTALALAAVWPRPVVLVEADPAGGDLAYRCRAAHGGPVSANRGLLRLAAAVRDGAATPDAVSNESQLLACGVGLVQGIASSAQSRGLTNLWPALAQACTKAGVDVIADLGRLDRASAALPVARAAEQLLVVASSSLESVMHLTEGLHDITAGLAGGISGGGSGGISGAVAGGIATGSTRRQPSICPVLVGPDAHAARDCAQLDDVLHRAGLLVAPTMPIPYDPRALQRLEQGERATRLRRTLYLRGARALAGSFLPGQLDDSSPQGFQDEPQSPTASHIQNNTQSHAQSDGRRGVSI